MRAPFDVVDLETGELIIEVGEEVSAADFWAQMEPIRFGAMRKPLDEDQYDFYPYGDPADMSVR